MTDFPNPDGYLGPTHINTYSKYFSGGVDAHLISGYGNPASAAYASANLAKYIPFVLPFHYIVKRLFWVNGSAAGGNWSIGLYYWNGTGIYASGSTAASGNSQAQYVTPSSDILLEPNVGYVLGLSHSATTANQAFNNLVSVAAFKQLGMYQEASAVPLPTDATFAAIANTGYELAGITRTASGF